MYCITKWTKHITDDGLDKYTGRAKLLRQRLAEKGQASAPLYPFRLLDDDGVIYAYGLSTDPDTFAPLDRYEPAYGCTTIQYKNPDTGRYETL